MLDAAFWEIYRNGFHGASIDRILDGTGITKGALFHHFSSKQHLGYAVVDEVVGAWVERHWVAPLADVTDPITGIPSCIRAYLDRGPEEILLGGCPFNNLTQEMAGIDEGFRLRLEAIAAQWRAAIADVWRRGQTEAVVTTDLDPEEAAIFTLSAIHGLLGSAKSARNREPALRATTVLTRLLERLR